MKAIAIVVAAAACGPAGGAALDAHGTDAANVADAPPVADADLTACARLPVIVRDFKFSHPDFEHFTTDMVTTGLVQPDLGADGTPTYAPAGATACTTGPAAFHDWYHDVAGTNLRLAKTLTLLETSPGTYVYDSAAFFPIDGEGFGNEGLAHNFAFTTEIHTAFEYRGGETFTFRGDDDVWLFVNGHLAIDLGGLHQPAGATIDLDAQAAALGLVHGHTYPMDIFQAERHTTLSNFRIETTIACFVVP